MCGIFGIIGKDVDKNDLKSLALLSRERGKDSSGFLTYDNDYIVRKFNKDIKYVVKGILPEVKNLAIGHSRLITNSTPDNQPILRKRIACIHNGIIVNFREIFSKYQLDQKLKIDSEIIPILVNYFLNLNLDLDQVINKILEDCEGIICCAVAIPKLGKMLLFSNNGSLYGGKKNGNFYFASENYFLNQINCEEIHKITKKILDIPKSEDEIINFEKKSEKREEFVPILTKNFQLEKLLIYENHQLKRCSKCILPSTMPFIKFDENGVCNYCKNYKNRNFVKFNSEKANAIFDKFRNNNKQPDCIIPLSGGRDSCFALHLAKTKFNLNPIAYTYDWGLVTDLARRNISRICSKLNVENIIFADDISKKRNFIKKNVLAWLKKPHLGMVNLFTAGDKHFYRHVKTVKIRTGLKLDLWGINPYEATHFKSGFLGVAPDFQLKKNNYTVGFFKQINYNSKRFRQALINPSYFNVSVIDNLYGELHRSVFKKTNHYSMFDFYKWNEAEVNEMLKLYDWEKSVDTKSTWRIGDGAAAFYNYIYYTMAGFSEHDTFRSNQIREGDITREKALELVKDESKPRYENIKWFLELINLDFKDTIGVINSNRLQS